MSNISHILGENEVELTDGDLAAVHGGREGREGREGRDWHGGGWGGYGGPAWGGYGGPAWGGYGGPAWGSPYGFYGPPAPQVVIVPVQSPAPTALETQPVVLGR